MRTLLFIILIFGICLDTPSQNFILAGDTNGTFIHFTDYIPDSIAGLGPEGNQFDLDIDNNGVNDLHFAVWLQHLSPYIFQAGTDVRILNDYVQIIVTEDSSFDVKELHLGDTVSDSQSVSYSVYNTLHFYYIWEVYVPPSVYTHGEFDNGWLGFRISYPAETFYGWIKMIAGFGHAVAYESAISGISVAQEDYTVSNDRVIIYPNPCKGILNVLSKTSNLSQLNFEIIDILGNHQLRGTLFDKFYSIDVSYLHPGIYFFKLHDCNNEIFSTKFLKQ